MQKFDNEYSLVLKCGSAYARPIAEEATKPEEQTSFEKKLIESALSVITNFKCVPNPQDKTADRICEYILKNTIEI